MGAPDDHKPSSNLESIFHNAVAGAEDPAAKRRSPPPFSLRLTAEERARLDVDAGNLPIGAYIRSRLFDGAPPRRNGNRRPRKDDQMLARLLAALGQSRVANNLNQLAYAANTGSLALTPDEAADLRASCDAVTAMRRDLMTALGLHSGGDHDSQG